MEETISWLAAGLVFMGIITQHDAQAAVAQPQLHPPAQQLLLSNDMPFLDLSQRLSVCQGAGVNLAAVIPELCLGDRIYLCANALIGLEGTVQSCVPGANLQARGWRKPAKRDEVLAG